MAPVRPQPGARAPLLLSALGRAYLAFCSGDERERVLPALRLSTNPLDAAAKDRLLDDVTALAFPPKGRGL